jgi:hypothetical protein
METRTRALAVCLTPRVQSFSHTNTEDQMINDGTPLLVLYVNNMYIYATQHPPPTRGRGDCQESLAPFSKMIRGKQIHLSLRLYKKRHGPSL